MVSQRFGTQVVRVISNAAGDNRRAAALHRYLLGIRRSWV